MFSLRYSMPRYTSALNITIQQIRKHIDDFEDWEVKQMAEEINDHLKLFPEQGNTELLNKFMRELVEEYVHRLR
jgi:hypothetical protein